MDNSVSYNTLVGHGLICAEIVCAYSGERDRCLASTGCQRAQEGGRGQKQQTTRVTHAESAGNESTGELLRKKLQMCFILTNQRLFSCRYHY